LGENAWKNVKFVNFENLEILSNTIPTIDVKY